MFKFLIIIPAYNEEKNVGSVLKNIQAEGLEVDVIVVDDGSLDTTSEVVEKLGFNVISHPFNIGYGAALQTGFKYADAMGYDYVIQFDADGQHDPSDLRIIISELKKGEYDIIVGSRFLGRGNIKIGGMKKLAIGFFRFLIKQFTGHKITDPTSGLKGISKPIFQYYSRMGSYPVDFPDADILIQIIKRKYKLKEFPANMMDRSSGRSMHSGLKPMYYVIKVLLSLFIILIREKFNKGANNE